MDHFQFLQMLCSVAEELTDTGKPSVAFNWLADVFLKFCAQCPSWWLDTLSVFKYSPLFLSGSKIN